MNYLKATKDVKRIMGSEHLLKLETQIYALNVGHEEKRWNTLGCMSCGVGIIHGKASKQKVNEKSTMESKVVEVSEYVNYKIHIIIIFLGQGCALHRKILY